MSAISTALAFAQTDDSGAQTADRYEWQAAMAAADGLSAYHQHQGGALKQLDVSEIRFICEYHEDWLIQLGGEVELVSAKHRELALGPWESITSLVSDGGVGHLFARWLMIGRSSSARLVTNAAIGHGEATEFTSCSGLVSSLEAGLVLTSAESEKLNKCLDIFCRSLMMYRRNLPLLWQASIGTRARDQTISDDLRVAAREFLLVFRVDQKRPERQLARHAAPSLYARPLLAKLGQPVDLAASVWEAVVQIFRVRMRAQGDTDQGGLPIIWSKGQASTPEQELEDRTVTLQDVIISVQTAMAHPSAYAPIPRPKRLTKLGVKMAQGKCADTSIARAERLKLDYSSYRRDRRNSVPGSAAELQLIERILLRIADEETHKVRPNAEHWGGDLWGALSARLHSFPEGLSEFQLDGDLALGGISELTARCQIWFSDYFDVESVIVKAKQDRGGSR